MAQNAKSTKSSIPTTRPIDMVVIHCSASPDTLDIGAAEITQWHKQRGFVTIGYHYVIRKDGTVEKGRPVEKIGAHCLHHNLFSIGICWVGMDDCNLKQMAALQDLVRQLRVSFPKITVESVKGHCELDPLKTCPRIDMNLFRKLIA